jgi:hypothetical protein
LRIEDDYELRDLAADLEAESGPTGANRGRPPPTALRQSRNHDSFADSAAHEESSLQDSKDTNSFSAPKHARRNRALWDSREILEDFGTIVHRFSHRRSEGGTASKMDEQTEKHDSEWGSRDRA